MDNLNKATDPADLDDLASASTPNGPFIVDHKFHVGNHPPHKEAEDFQENIAKNPETVESLALPNRMEETSIKSLYKSPKTNQKFLLKPYHEALNENVPSQRFPIAGWAELATQKLFHAGDIGYMVQKSHVSEHPTSKGMTPMVVIALDKKANRSIEDFQNYYGPYPHQMYDDAVKMGMMDFLANNNDRHNENAMYHESRTGSKNMASHLLAIDHGRSFGYKRPNRWALPEKHPVDSLYAYIAGGGLSAHESLVRPDFGWNPWSNAHLQHGVEWWESNRQKIRDEMKNQLQGIVHPEVKDYIARNFDFRTQALDKFAKAWRLDPEAEQYIPLVNPAAMRIHSAPMLPFLPPPHAPAQEKVA